MNEDEVVDTEDSLEDIIDMAWDNMHPNLEPGDEIDIINGDWPTFND